RPGTAPAPGLRAAGAVVIRRRPPREGDDHVFRLPIRSRKPRRPVSPARQPPRHLAARLWVEALEDRSLPSCTVALAPSDNSPLVGERVTWTATADDCGANHVFQFS